MEQIAKTAMDASNNRNNHNQQERQEYKVTSNSMGASKSRGFNSRNIDSRVYSISIDIRNVSSRAASNIKDASSSNSA